MSLDEVGATLRISRFNLASSSLCNLRRNLDSKLRVMLILEAKKKSHQGSSQASGSLKIQRLKASPKMRIYISLFLWKSANHIGLFLTEIVFDKLSISDSLEMTNWFDNLRLFTIFRSLLVYYTLNMWYFFKKVKPYLNFFILCISKLLYVLHRIRRYTYFRVWCMQFIKVCKLQSALALTILICIE